MLTYILCIRVSQNALKVAVRMRLGYLRKPEDNKRGKASGLPGSTPTRTEKPKKPAIPNIPTNTGEDKASMARRFSLLKVELRKTVPNKTVIQDLMARTFSVRREDIQKENLSVMDCLVKYPALRFPSQVCMCFYDSLFI